MVCVLSAVRQPHTWLALYLLAVLGVSAQLTERPGNSLDDPVLVPRDLTGLSIKTPRVRVVHTSDPAL